ncbi:heterokaryon incompatibility protein-domain-containing protein [Hyaloscypha finlandica]|nr:heterokaryon incompatibility protein-domain-containing protein [Hyaloscypha finlandica]
MNLVGLEFDHPAFPSRLRLTLETCLSFAAAGAGHGVFSVACAGLMALQLWPFMANEDIKGYTSLNLINIILINALGAWNSFSSRVSRDYRLHFGNEPSTSRLLLLELLRLSGFFFSRAFLLQHAAIFTAPLCFFAPKPSTPLSVSYIVLIVWALFRILPEHTVMSSRSFTLPRFVAHMTASVSKDYSKEIAAAILKPLSLASSDTQTQYRYAPIPTTRTIRLLRIDCREKTASCALEAVKLDDAPPFWAVSYLWGSEDKPQLLHVTGGSSPDAGYIPITSNCAAVIQALIPMGVRYLWIDAVCINQIDASEKELQVPLMGQIYSQASLVVGHLYTENTMSVTTLLHRMVQSLANGKKFAMDSGGANQIYRTLSEVLNHQYFQRAWIVQEIVLAKSLLLIHGKDCMSLDHLITISKAQKGEILPERSDSGLFQTWMTRIPNDQNNWKLQEWLQFTMYVSEFKGRAAIIENLRLSVREKDASHALTVAQIVDHNPLLQAKYPRDQVYALLSLASDSTVPELQPNYNFAVSDKEIFTGISWHYLQAGQLNLFLSAGLATKVFELERPRTPGLPSWVYDFSSGPAREFSLGNWAVDVERNRAARLTCSLSPEYLSVRGMIIDKVAFVASQAIQPDDVCGKPISDIVTITRDLMQRNMLLVDETRGMAQNYVPDPYPGGVKREEAYWRTMIMDRFCDQTPAPSEAEDFLVWTHDMWRQLQTNMAPLDPSKFKRRRTEEQFTAGIISLMTRITGVWMPNTFVVLDSGYMGWSPLGVQAGDVFCLFDGCIVPFVLRPTLGAGTFSLCGAGYAHGFMPGQQPGVEERPWEWIKIV